MKDFEQLYYDVLYKNKQLKKEIKQLQEEIEVYKLLSKKDSLKSIIASDLIKFINKKNLDRGDEKECHLKY